MKLIVLLSVLGLAVGCGTDISYTRTLASEEKTEQTKKDNGALKIAGITAGVALAGCIIVGVVKKKCIPFAKKVAQNVEGGTTPTFAGVSEAEVKEAVKDAFKKAQDNPEVKKAEKEMREAFEEFKKDIEEVDAGLAKIKELNDAIEARHNRLKNRPKPKPREEIFPSSGIPKDREEMIKAMDEAGIPISNVTYGKLIKNMENGSVFIPNEQLDALLDSGGFWISHETRMSLNKAWMKSYHLIKEQISEVTRRSEDFLDNVPATIQQLVDEGIFTDEIAKKVTTQHSGEWLPVTEIFK